MPNVIDRRRLVDVERGSGRGSSGSASVSPMSISSMPDDRDDVAGFGLVDLDTVERLGHVQLASTFARSIVPSARHHATCCPRGSSR